MERITMAHGAGGTVMNDLIKNHVLRHFGGSRAEVPLEALDDSAVVDGIVLKSDSHAVKPLFFPGGDIGSLAIHGTVNDVAMSGADPVAISVGFILEEGFAISELDKIAGSMASAAQEAGIRIVTADTKVVSKGAADKVFINTTGIGVIREGLSISGDMARIGDIILLSGTVGDHSIAVASSREGIEFQTLVVSDSAPLNGMIGDLVSAIGTDIHVLRDPTRGGLASVLNEIASQSSVGVQIEEAAIPVRDAVKGACELLGYDPLYLANEGKLVAVVAENAREEALKTIRSHKYGREGRFIGNITGDHPGKVVLKTAMGGKRLVDKLSGDMLPRIC